MRGTVVTASVVVSRAATLTVSVRPVGSARDLRLLSGHRVHGVKGAVRLRLTLARGALKRGHRYRLLVSGGGATAERTFTA